MTHLHVHAFFAGIGWLTLTLMGLSYKLLPLEVGADKVSLSWGIAASVLINTVFWGVFFSYAYDWVALRLASAVLAFAGLVCHSLQVRAMTHQTGTLTRWLPASLSRRQGHEMQADGTRPPAQHPVSLPYTAASCFFGMATGLLAIVLTTGLVAERLAVVYAFAYAAGGGWFGLYVAGQTTWLLPLLLHDEPGQRAPPSAWESIEWLGLVVGTALVTLGLLAGVPRLVALGAAVNLMSSLVMAARSRHLGRAQPVMAGC
jgi:hypothetical protein